MNDVQLRTMYEQINKYTGTSRLNPHFNAGYKAGFKAACEWRDIQVEEAVAMNEAVSKHQTDAYVKLIEIRNNIDLAMMDLSKAHLAIAKAKGEQTK